MLVLANKQDLPQALSAKEVCEKMGLKEEVGDKLGHSWYLQPTVATSGDGVYEGLKWLGEELNGR